MIQEHTSVQLVCSGSWNLSTFTCTDPEGGADPEGGGPPPPPPLKNHKNIGFFSNTGPEPLKNQLGHHRPASETPLNGISLVGR